MSRSHLIGRDRVGALMGAVAIMTLLSALALAAALGLGQATRTMRANMANRITIQIVAADAQERDRQVTATEKVLETVQGVSRVQRVDPAALRAMLEPWLATGLAQNDIAIPAMIDVDFAPAARPSAGDLRAILRKTAPAARVDDHGRWLAPLDRLLGWLRWLALAVVGLTMTALAAMVVLATRAAFATRRDAIDLMHLLGATDRQIAGLFVRRAGGHALVGGLAGYLGALALLFGLGQRIAGLGSELVGALALLPATWMILLLVPIAGTGLAMATTQAIILKILRQAP